MDTQYYFPKIAFDLAGYLTAFVTTWFFYRKMIRPEELPNPFRDRNQRIEYYLYVIAGAMFGGMIISTFDGAMISGRNPIE